MVVYCGKGWSNCARLTVALRSAEFGLVIRFASGFGNCALKNAAGLVAATPLTSRLSAK